MARWPMMRFALPDHGAGGDIEGGEQRDGAMAEVVVGDALDVAESLGQNGFTCERASAPVRGVAWPFVAGLVMETGQAVVGVPTTPLGHGRQRDLELIGDRRVGCAGCCGKEKRASGGEVA